MPKSVGIIQSNYIPWKGYFDFVDSVDEFVILDDVQYTRRDWRNRNILKSPSGPKWLSIPVNTRGKYEASIEEIEVANHSWPEQHWAKICSYYAKAPAFEPHAEWLKSLYDQAVHLRKLSEINYLFLSEIASFLQIETPMHWSSSWPSNSTKSERLLELCMHLQADRYISGPAAKAYLDETLFAQNGITVSYFDYSGYVEYPQLWSHFDHHVTILDVILNTGQEAGRFALKNRQAA